MDVALSTAIGTGLGDIKDIVLAVALLAVPVGFGIWAIKVAIRQAPAIIRGFFKG